MPLLVCLWVSTITCDRLASKNTSLASRACTSCRGEDHVNLAEYYTSPGQGWVKAAWLLTVVITLLELAKHTVGAILQQPGWGSLWTFIEVLGAIQHHSASGRPSHLSQSWGPTCSTLCRCSALSMTFSTRTWHAISLEFAWLKASDWQAGLATGWCCMSHTNVVPRSLFLFRAYASYVGVGIRFEQACKYISLPDVLLHPEALRDYWASRAQLTESIRQVVQN